MKNVIKTLLKTGLCILDQADADVRSRVSATADDLNERARRTYGEASHRLDRASRAIRGEDDDLMCSCQRAGHKGIDPFQSLEHWASSRRRNRLRASRLS